MQDRKVGKSKKVGKIRVRSGHVGKAESTDNGFDYPNNLCVQNAFLRRLNAIAVLYIRLD